MEIYKIITKYSNFLTINQIPICYLPIWIAAKETPINMQRRLPTWVIVFAEGCQRESWQQRLWLKGAFGHSSDCPSEGQSFFAYALEGGRVNRLMEYLNGKCFCFGEGNRWFGLFVWYVVCFLHSLTSFPFIYIIHFKFIELSFK
jgi:hypothetical protein